MLTEKAARALAAFEWGDGWQWRQTGRYHPFGGYDGPKVLYKDVPARIIHELMCRGDVSQSSTVLARCGGYGTEKTS
jgi:hypothetical protein